MSFIPKSGTLKMYLNSKFSSTQEEMAKLTPEQLQLCDEIYAECEKHYSDGGDTVCECFEPAEVLEEFKSVADAREYCGLKVEQATNCRWGEDSDPEVELQRRYDENWKE